MATGGGPRTCWTRTTTGRRCGTRPSYPIAPSRCWCDFTTRKTSASWRRPRCWTSPSTSRRRARGGRRAAGSRRLSPPPKPRSAWQPKARTSITVEIKTRPSTTRTKKPKPRLRPPSTRTTTWVTQSRLPARNSSAHHACPRGTWRRPGPGGRRRRPGRNNAARDRRSSPANWAPPLGTCTARRRGRRRDSRLA